MTRKKYNRAVGDYDMAAQLTAAIMERERLHAALSRIEPLLEQARPLPAHVIVRQALYPPIPEPMEPT